MGSTVPAHFAGFTKITDYICKIESIYTNSMDRRRLIEEGMRRIRIKEQALLQRIISGLQEIEGAKAHFNEQPIKQKDPILAIIFGNVDCQRAVSEYGKRARHISI
ncbi:hypothetical protein CWR48_05310 [Oceanobacillus arenosus]|uniref:Uncharacterized protein n=1 Tax=Oceanobacillus arenosus TaxID=1229153 RepID=A0A3D8PY93_9BACI|nr:hypothetical protein [Oceanobacillus arenosus]RDW20129.1 hypothetical protein CWR48_05310 [Oceanobacillus arenosus]